MSDDWQPNFGNLSSSTPQWATKRPVRIALLGDFSGRASAGILETGADLAKRKPMNVEFDSLEDMLSRLDINLQLPLGDDGSVSVALSDLDSFHPDQLYRELPLFTDLAGLRKQLNNTATFDKAAAKVQAMAGQGSGKVSKRSRKSKARGAALAIDSKLDDFSRLVGLPSTPEAAASSVDALMRNVLAPFVVAAANPKKDALVASVDQALSDAMRAVLHHADFQALESLWRGADFVLRRLETGPNLQVHLIDVSAEELAADLSAHDDLSECAIYKMLVDTPSQDKTGGYTLLCGLYHFEPTPPHTELLGRMAQIAQHAAAPFVTSMGIDSLTDRKRPPHALVQQAFKALQQMPASSHLSLMAPRFMLRHPYGKRTDPISVFDFEEFTADAGLRAMLWGHPALLAACVVAGNDGLTIGDLPFYHFRDADGDTTALPCTERLINSDVATTLGQWGFSALMAHKGAPELRIAGLDAVNGQPLGKAAVPGSKPRIGVETKVGVGSHIAVTTKAKVPAKSAPSDDSSSSSSDDTDSFNFDSDSSSSDDSGDLDALLAGLGDDSSSSSDSSSGGDDDLDALLASLGGDDSSSSSDSSDSAGGDEMDADLAALLASLG
jgi:type VI secretion system protein ImpC